MKQFSDEQIKTWLQLAATDQTAIDLEEKIMSKIVLTQAERKVLDGNLKFAIAGLLVSFVVIILFFSFDLQQRLHNFLVQYLTVELVYSQVLLLVGIVLSMLFFLQLDLIIKLVLKRRNSLVLN